MTAAALAPQIFGIVNITEDSFSDGGKYLAPDAAIAHAKQLAADGADVVDLGAASSRPDAKPVPPDVEIERLAPVVAALKEHGLIISIDSFSPKVQQWALKERVDFLNDVRGFPDTDVYAALAGSRARLVVMHSVEGRGPPTRVNIPAGALMDRILRLFESRISALVSAGIDRNRLILDPGMGLFLGTDANASFAVLRHLPEMKRAFGLPILISVSRKSFLRRLVGRGPSEAGAATLAAEILAVLQGADYIRTHEPRPLGDALRVWQAFAFETDRNVP